MEFLVASGIGWVAACGIYLMLRGRSFPVVLGLTLLGYAVNVFIFAMGRLWSNAPPILGKGRCIADPLPQALVLTAIVIGFATTGFVIELALRSRARVGHRPRGRPGGPDGSRMNASFMDDGLQIDHLPVLPVLLPAATAMLLLLIGDHGGGAACQAGRVASRWCRSLLGLLIALQLAFEGRYGRRPAVYRMGDWPAPFGIVLVVDRLSALMLVLTSAGRAAGAAGMPAAAGTATAATSMRCSSSS
jgi:multicomponent K+:H+ antiporter subunit C